MGSQSVKLTMTVARVTVAVTLKDHFYGLGICDTALVLVETDEAFAGLWWG